MIRAKFAVVGHPNKGKSSIVSTLSNNDSIQVSQRSGTTTSSSAYRVETRNSGYELFDTPGFQRPTKVLAWLKSKASQADQRAQAVSQFVTDPECQNRFPDEVELLTPLVNGAAILYVVDGSRPYGNEYETEMEILQWTGQPSMALINPIENEDHVEAWKSALNQYFKTVRVFNPMQAEFEKQIELLKTFAHLNPQWSQHLELVTEDLIISRQRQLQDSATLLTRLIEDLCFYQQSQKVLSKSQAQAIQPILAKKYQHWMTAREQAAIKALFSNYAHFQTNLSIDDLHLPPDLFDCEQWYMWGLNKRQLATVATITGASAGAAVDLAVAGHSFMLGAIGGGLLGFGSAWLGANKLAETKIIGLPLGGYEAIYGPLTNRNFPYVIIGRFIFLHQQVSLRSHAVRSDMKINASELHLKISSLEKSSQKELHVACEKLTKGKLVPNLSTILLPLFSKAPSH